MRWVLIKAMPFPAKEVVSEDVEFGILPRENQLPPPEAVV